MPKASANGTAASVLKIAAAGDIHCHEGNAERVGDSLDEMAGAAELILLAGDLTNRGEPAEARALAAAIEGISTPVVAVLGNHDAHAGKAEEVSAILSAAGAVMLERDTTILTIGSEQVGVVGLKGFVGGFAPNNLPNFGEPILRELYAETGRDVHALEEGLGEVAACRFRIVLLHYAPICETLRGEPPEIWTFLGSERLAAPIAEERPDLVLHGHAHAGTLEGSIGPVPVVNVAIPVIGRDYWTVELTAPEVASSPAR
jgi:Icc-related predicted phosphoesterase